MGSHVFVTLNYVLCVMRADNDGEGGITALITTIRRRGMPGGRRTRIALAGLECYFGLPRNRTVIMGSRIEV